MIDVEWKDPLTTPDVNKGDEKQFWLALSITRKGVEKIHTFLAYYQNRPYQEGDEKEDDDALVNIDGDYINSVGWVSCKSHVEFDNYYEPITINENSKLLGWAEYTPPEFKEN